MRIRIGKLGTAALPALFCVALLATVNSASAAQTFVGLPSAPKAVAMPQATKLRRGSVVRGADGQLAFLAAPPPVVRQAPAAPQASKSAAAAKPKPKPPYRQPVRSAADVRALVEGLAPKYGLDPRLVLAVIDAESGFRADAVSPKGAVGLMQLIPDTARRFGVRDSRDPIQNVRGGMAYLQWLLAYFRGNLRLALAGYNAGEGAVTRAAGVPAYAETQAYVRKILASYGQRHHPFDARLARAAPFLGK